MENRKRKLDHTDFKVCEICYEGLPKKRIVVIGCWHEFHRTCLLNWCESSYGVNEKPSKICPICEVPIKVAHEITTNGLIKLHTISAFGPTGQPSFGVLADFLRSKKHSTHIDVTVELTRKLLLQVADQLKCARESSKSKEYIDDIIEEETNAIFDLCSGKDRIFARFLTPHKLLMRLNVLEVMKKIWSDFESANRSTVREAISMLIYKDAVEVEKDVTPSNADNNDQSICPICINILAGKRTMTLQPCNHKFHRSCGLRWFEEQDIQLKDNTCCLCRAETSKCVSDFGDKIHLPFPFELWKDDLQSNKMSDIDIYEHLKIVEMYKYDAVVLVQLLAKERRLALGRGESEEYISEIDQEWTKLRRRARSIDIRLIRLVEIEKLNKMN